MIEIPNFKELRHENTPLHPQVPARRRPAAATPFAHRTTGIWSLSAQHERCATPAAAGSSRQQPAAAGGVARGNFFNAISYRLRINP